MDYQVTCITKSSQISGHEHITHLGGPSAGGWYYTKEKIIGMINAKTDNFYTIDESTGRKVYVGVFPANPPYLRTHADRKWNDNLLAQRPCR